MNGQFIRRLFYFVIVWTMSTVALVSQSTTAQWRNTSSLPQALCLHRSVLLHTGEVLVCGGLNSAGTAQTTSLLYTQGQWKPTASALRNARFDHALVAVRNARGESVVFAIGGYSGSTNAYSSLNSIEALSFNTTTKTWSWQSVGTLSAALGGCAAAYDKKGGVIVSGGRVLANGALSAGVPSVLSYRIDVNSFAVTRLGDMATARSEHATLMLNGARGDSTVLSACGETNTTPATEILNAGLWDARANPPAMEHIRCCAISDLAEVARMIGGYDAAGVATNRGEWYDTKAGWRAMPRMQTARARAGWTLVAGIRDTSPNYLIVAGQSTGAATATTELFSLPSGGAPNGAWTPFSDVQNAYADRTVAINEDNLALVVGGNSSSITQPIAQSSCEIYQPLTANDLNFGQEEVGRESARTLVTFRNTWLLPVMLSNLRVPASAEFRLTNARDSIVIPPGGTVDIDVRFRPGSIGPTSAVLLANIGSLVDTVRLQGEGIKSSISILNKSIDFGSRLLLSDSTICFAAIRNDGKDTTVIDSVVVLPSTEFTVLSPIGRTRIAPDSTMIVCVKYHPSTRQQVTASLEVHISDRSYPLAVVGTGLRRFVTVTQQGTCDTVTVAPGDSLRYTLVVSNSSDRTVHIDSTLIKTALAGTFHLAQPSPFPLDLPPGASTNVSIVFQPQREAQEQGSIQFINNGDTLCAVTLCFIPRNRSVTIDIPQSSALKLCEGDSISIPIILENPGNFDVLRLDSVYVKNMSYRVIGFNPQSLQPRQNTSLDLILVPSGTGVQSATIVVESNQGQSQNTIPLNVLPSMKFSIDNASATIGSQFLLRVRRSDNLSSVNTTQLELQYNGTMIHPLQIVNAPSRNYVDITNSSMNTLFGKSILNIRWASHPTQSDEVFDILCEALRGNDFSAAVSLNSGSTSSICIQDATATLSVSPECGGRTGLIDAQNAVVLMSFPSPAVDNISIRLQAAKYEHLELRLVRADGTVVHNAAALKEQLIDGMHLSSGLYMCQVLSHGIPILSQPITLLH